MSEDTRITREPSLSVAGAYVRATGAGTAVGSAGRWSSSDFTSTQNVRFGSSSHCWPSSSGRRPSLYAPGTGGASTLNWNHCTWPGPTYGVDCVAGRFAWTQLVGGEPLVPSPPSELARSCPGSGPHVPSAALPYQPSEPVLRNAIVTVVGLPGQSVRQPDRPEV